MISALGYFSVAVACTIAGFAVGHPRAFGWSNVPWFRFLGYFGLLFPAYLNRATLYEGARRRFLDGTGGGGTTWQRRHSIELPCTALAVGVFFIVVMRAWTVCDGMRAVVSAIPIYALSVYATARWPRDRELFDFRFRSFFPAFATCLPTFVFGFSECNGITLSVITTFAVLVAWTIAHTIRESTLVQWSTLVLLVLFVSSVIVTIHSPTRLGLCIQISFFGVLLTLAMGVSEAFRVTVRILQDREYRPGGIYPAADKLFYLGGTNLAAATFLTTFPLTFLLPATTRTYLLLVGLLLLTEYLLWFFDDRIRKKGWWTKLGVLFGFALPSIVAVGTDLRNSTARLDMVRPSIGLSEAVGVCAAAATLAGWMAKRYLWDPPDKGGWMAYFVSKRHSIAATGVVASCLAFFLGCATGIVYSAKGTVTSQTDARILILVWLYLIIGVACGVFLVGIALNSRKRDVAPPDEKSTPIGSARSLILTTRPAASIAAGMVCLVAISSRTSSTSAALLATTCMTLVTMFGFVLNDVLDYEKDRRAAVRRPIASDALSLRSAIVLATILLTTGLTISVLLPASWFLATVAAALLVYTPVARAAPLLKGPYTAALSLAPLRYATLISSTTLPIRLSCVLVVFVLGREVLMDAIEVSCDAGAGMRTIAVRYIPSSVASAGRTCMCLASAALVGLSTSALTAAIATVACLIVLISTVVNDRLSSRQIALTRYAMIIAAIAVGLIK